MTLFFLKKKQSIQRTMILYFLMIVFSSLLLGIEFTAETNRLIHQTESTLEKGTDVSGIATLESKALRHIRSKSILMIIMVQLVILIVFLMFIKNITAPLQHMIEVARSFSGGDLSSSIDISQDNELKELGNTINELSCNLQEIILFSQNLYVSGKTIADQAENHFDTSQPAEPFSLHLNVFNNELEMFGNMIEGFSFYQTPTTQDQDQQDGGNVS